MHDCYLRRPLCTLDVDECRHPLRRWSLPIGKSGKLDPSIADFDTDEEPSSLSLNLLTYFPNMAFSSSSTSVWVFVPARTWDSFSSRSSCLLSMAAVRWEALLDRPYRPSLRTPCPRLAHVLLTNEGVSVDCFLG
jgi:hypothetical protein